jgi:hypothetical protein
MALRVGQGFTLKGSGALSGTQNYTFEGSQIMEQLLQNSVRADQLLLTGNPYPSAMDATAFINDNSTMDGTLYFWELRLTTHIFCGTIRVNAKKLVRRSSHLSRGRFHKWLGL